MNPNQIAQVASFLNVSPNQVKRCEEWSSVLFVQVHGCRPRFVSKKVISNMRCIQVGVCRETVVIDAESQMGYVVRSGYDMGNVYLVKKFNPSGMDIRMLDYSSILGERIKPDSSEYAPVIEAIGWSKPSLEGFGAPGKVLFPAGYKVK